MREPSPQADLFFSVAAETFVSMTGVQPTCSEAEHTDIAASGHDVTVIMGILGGEPLSCVLALDGSTVRALTDAVLRTEAGAGIDEMDAEEIPELMQGAVEELTNRTSAGFINRLSSEEGGSFSLTPPLCVFGKGSDLGGAINGAASLFDSALGPILFMLATEGAEAPA